MVLNPWLGQLHDSVQKCGSEQVAEQAEEVGETIRDRWPQGQSHTANT
jgi:hypothetical protein